MGSNSQVFPADDNLHIDSLVENCIEELLSSCNWKFQLQKIKSITALVKQSVDGQEEGFSSAAEKVVDIFVNIYLGSDLKHPVKRLLASCLQSLPFPLHADIENEISRKLSSQVFTCDLRETSIDELRSHVNIIGGLLDNFNIGEVCVKRMCLEVLSFLANSLELFVQSYSPHLPPVEHNETMHHCHVTLQTTNRTLQKCSKDIRCLIEKDPSAQELFTNIAEKISNCSKTVLSQDNFLLNGRSTAAISLGLFLNLLSKKAVVSVVTRIISPNLTEGRKVQMPQWFGSSSSIGLSDLDLSMTSVLCICHGLLGVIDTDDMVTEFSPKKCLLVDVFLDKLLEISQQHLDAGSKVLLGKALVVWATRACSVLESSARGGNLADVFKGPGPVVQKLLSYVWTTWEEPVDALKLSSRQIFEETVKIHLLASKSDAKTDSFLQSLVSSLMSVSWSTKGKYGPLTCLVEHVGANQIVQSHPGLPDDILTALEEQAMSCYASELYEKLCRVHLQEVNTGSSSKECWENCWIDPILTVLCGKNKDQKVNVLEYVLPKVLKVDSSVLGYMIVQLSTEPGDRIHGTNRLGALIMCLRRARAVGLLQHKSVMSEHNSSDKMFGVIDFSLLKQALSSCEEQVRLDAFALLCENKKTSEALQKTEFDLLKFFIHINLNSQSASFRQMFLSYLKKLFLRMEESALVISRLMSKAKPGKTAYGGGLCHYRDFCTWLLGYLFDSVFCGAAFARITTALSALSLLITTFGKASASKLLDLSCVITPNHIRTLVECLTDTFEENKLQALKILDQLPSSELIGKEDWILPLFKAATELSVSTKPQDSSTAAYLYRLLIKQRQFRSIAFAAFRHEKDVEMKDVLDAKGDDALILEENVFLSVKHLLISLNDQLLVARTNILRAAATKPLYPSVHCVRCLLADFKLSNVKNKDKWRTMLAELIDTCCDVAEVVSPVVHNSSPEGNIPLEAIKGLKLSEILEDNPHQKGVNKSDSSEKTAALMPEYLVVCCWRSIKEVSLLLGELTLHAPIINPEHQGELDGSSRGLLTYKQIINIGEYFITQLLESKHRGAFELAYTGFVRMMEMLWRNPISLIRELPLKWLAQVMEDIQSVDGKSRLCATRRSAGVPFYVQAVLVTEPVVMGRAHFKSTMTRLLELALKKDTFNNDKKSSSADNKLSELSRVTITDNHPVTGMTDTKALPVNTDAKVHALNILRALYRDTRLGKDVALYVADGVKAAILGFSSPDWAIRNASTLLFSALMTRIFGVKRSKDETGLSKKNCLTGRIFFHRYPSLYEFLLSRLEEATLNIGDSGRLHLHPGLYPILMMLGRLTPSVMEGGDTSLSLAPFIPFVVRCAASPVLKTRLMAARALQPLVFKDQVIVELSDLIQGLPTSPSDHMTQNHTHGLLLQIKELLDSVKHLSSALLTSACHRIPGGLLKCQWLMTRNNSCVLTRKEMIDTVSVVVDIPWQCDSRPLEELKSTLVNSVDNEIGKMDDCSPHLPGLNEFLTSVATTSLKFLPQSSTNLTLKDKLLTFLECDFYEVRIVALEFLKKCFKETERDGMKEKSCEVMEGIVNDVINSPVVLHKLVTMAVGEEKWNPCLIKVLRVLYRVPSSWERLLTVNLNPSKVFDMALTLGKETASDELRSAVIIFLGEIFTDFYQRAVSQPSEVSETVTLEAWISLLEESSKTEQREEVKVAVARVIVRNASQLLIDPDCLLGSLTLRMWHVTFELLQDDDLEVKDVMTAVLPAIDKSVSEPVHSVLAVDLLLEKMTQSQFTVHTEDWFNLLVNLMIREDNSDEAVEERLFDKGEMNTYKEDVIMTRIVAKHLKVILNGRCSDLNSGGTELVSTTLIDTAVGNVCRRLGTVISLQNFSLVGAFLKTSQYHESVSLLARLLIALECLTSCGSFTKTSTLSEVMTQIRTVVSDQICSHLLLQHITPFLTNPKSPTSVTTQIDVTHTWS